MLLYDAALQCMLSNARPLDVERVPFEQAAARVLAEPIVANRDDPPALKSAMDGFALRSGDTFAATAARPVRFSYSQIIAAGSVPAEGLRTGSTSSDDSVRTFPAVRIMTGAMLPDGADAVVKQEDVKADGPGRFTLCSRVSPLENTIPRGARMERGENLLAAGEVIGPQGLGILAMAHVDGILVHRRPIVAVLAIGNELVSPAQPLAPGKIPVSNLFVIGALARRYGAAVRIMEICPDDPAAIYDRLMGQLLGQTSESVPCDLAITLGGTHRGDYDFIHEVLNRLKARVEFDRVAMSPGASTIFATLDHRLIVGLPGTPAASWIAFETLVRPALAKMSGQSQWLAPKIPAILSEPLTVARNRIQFVPCRLEWDGGQYAAIPIRGRNIRESPASMRAQGIIRVDESLSDYAQGSLIPVDWIAD